jgi:hypothetical protein
MTFNPLAAINSTFISSISSIPSLIKDKRKAVDLGSQTLSFDHNFIKFLIQKFPRLDKLNINNLEKIILKMEKKEKIYTKDFFLSLGFNDYISIDINGAYGSLNFDLNKDIFKEFKYNETFDLTINNGTGEHIFNQFMVFKNAHNLTKKDGYMLHILPFIDWINHGFFSFHPIVFADLAAANDYQIEKLALANRDGAEIIIKKEEMKMLFEQIKPNQPLSSLGKLVKFSKEKLGQNILIVAILKKINNNSFKVPLQGKYLSDIKNDTSHLYYNQQKPGSSLSENQLPDNIKRK